jgi:hypothetical protein
MKIVRRKMKQGGTIGRYMVITSQKKEGFYARYIGEKSEFWLAESLNNFQEISTVKCKVSISDFERLKHAICFSHIWAPTWRRIYEEKPKIIKFWAPNCGYLYVCVSIIKKKVENKAPNIYIEITERVYEPLSKQKQD